MKLKLTQLTLALVLFLSQLFVSTSVFAQKKKNEKNIKEVKSTFIVKGKIHGVIQQEELILGELYNNRVTPFDTTNINTKDSTFEFKGYLNEDMMVYLILSQSTIVPLILSPESEHFVDIKLSNSGIEFEVKGKGVEKSQKIRNYLEEYSRIEYSIQALQDMFNSGKIEISRASEFETEYYRLLNQLRLTQELVMSDSTNPLGSYFVFNAFLESPTKQDYERVFRAFTIGDPNSKYLSDLQRRYDIEKSTMVGEYAPNIALPNPDGDTVELYSLRGKVVLIDFWASWCGPCRRENPNNKRIYEKFSPKGFEIYAVSLDRTMNDWVKTIAADGLPWIHVSDLAYWNSAPAKMYKVRSIPATYLLDKEGRILAINLRGQELEQFLDNFFK